MVPATHPVRAEHDPHIVLGLVGDPGAAISLARELAESGLEAELNQRLPGARWCIEVVEGRLVQPPATDDEIVKAAWQLLLKKEWDVVVCLTDLPLHVDQRPVVAHATPVRNVAPMLSASDGDHVGRPSSGCVNWAATRPTRRSSIPPDPDGQFDADLRDGGRQSAVAVVDAIVACVDRRGCRRSDWLGDRRHLAALRRLRGAWLAGTSLVSIGATAATLIIGGELWEPIVSRAVRKQVILFNIATVVTVLIGITVLYAALYVLALVAAYWFVVPQSWKDQVGHPALVRDYFELAWCTCSLAMIGGALGAALEPDEAVRAAASVQHPDGEDELEKATWLRVTSPDQRCRVGQERAHRSIC